MEYRAVFDFFLKKQPYFKFSSAENQLVLYGLMNGGIRRPVWIDGLNYQ